MAPGRGPWTRDGRPGCAGTRIPDRKSILRCRKGAPEAARHRPIHEGHSHGGQRAQRPRHQLPTTRPLLQRTGLSPESRGEDFRLGERPEAPQMPSHRIQRSRKRLSHHRQLPESQPNVAQGTRRGEKTQQPPRHERRPSKHRHYLRAKRNARLRMGILPRVYERK